MNSQQLKLFAVVTAVAALLFAYLAFQTSREQQARQQLLEAESLQGPSHWSKAVVALTPLPQGQAITEAAVKLVPVAIAPAEGFTRLEDVVGRTPVATIGTGEPLTQRHFSEGSDLSRALGEHERAVAIKVNEVVSVGGLIGAGDYVDVLVYVPADGRQVKLSQAQVALERLRVLAYGGDAGAARASDRTAVLAVPTKDVSRLVLAANAGDLRLALHGARPADAAAPLPAALLRDLDRTPVVRAPVRTREEVTVYRAGEKSRVVK
ncbi:MAG: Flp pilus assembly protein CpaB [Gammaproteobacteria bacterium]|nr:Flp pilus assembly protein CpaB [Gammaproteobacteria bacterium]